MVEGAFGEGEWRVMMQSAIRATAAGEEEEWSCAELRGERRGMNMKGKLRSESLNLCQVPFTTPLLYTRPTAAGWEWVVMKTSPAKRIQVPSLYLVGFLNASLHQQLEETHTLILILLGVRFVITHRYFMYIRFHL